MDCLAIHGFSRSLKLQKLIILPDFFESFRSTPSLRLKANPCFVLAISFPLKVNLLQASQLSNSTAFSSDNAFPLNPRIHFFSYLSLSLLSLLNPSFLSSSLPFLFSHLCVVFYKKAPFPGSVLLSGCLLFLVYP